MKIVFLTIIFFSGLIFFITPFFATKKYVCITDHSISDTYQDALEKRINTISQIECLPIKIIAALKTEFPFIKKIDLSYFPHISAMHVKMYKPKSVINGTSVLTRNNIIVEKSIYCTSALESLPHIEVKNETIESTSALLSAFIDGLPKNFHLSHDLIIFSRHNAVLQDKSEPRFCIKCCADQFITPTTFVSCEIIKNQVIEREKKSKNKSITWMADIRFANQIIVYKKMGEKSWHVL